MTGASSGIGEDTASALLAAGYIVCAGAGRIGQINPLSKARVRAPALHVTDETSITNAGQSIVRPPDRAFDALMLMGARP